MEARCAGHLEGFPLVLATMNKPAYAALQGRMLEGLECRVCGGFHSVLATKKKPAAYAALFRCAGAEHLGRPGLRQVN